MLRFRQMKSLQKFASVHASLHNHFNSERHLVDRLTYKLRRTGRVAEPHGLRSRASRDRCVQRRRVRIGLTAPIEAIDTVILRAQDNPDQSNASRLRMNAILALLKREKDKRAKAKAQDIERDAPGRSR